MLHIDTTVSTFALALVVVVGAFVFFMARGADPVITPILAGALGVVLSYFFAQHLANGAARTALDTIIKERAVTNAALDAAAATKPPGA